MDDLDVPSGDVGLITVDSLKMLMRYAPHERDQFFCISARSRLHLGPMNQQGVRVHSCVKCRKSPSLRLFESDGHPLPTSGVGETGGVHRDVSGRRSLPSKESIHPVEEPGVQSLQSLLKAGVGGRSLKTKSLEEQW